MSLWKLLLQLAEPFTLPGSLFKLTDACSAIASDANRLAGGEVLGKSSNYRSINQHSIHFIFASLSWPQLKGLSVFANNSLGRILHFARYPTIYLEYSKHLKSSHPSNSTNFSSHHHKSHISHSISASRLQTAFDHCNAYFQPHITRKIVR